MIQTRMAEHIDKHINDAQYGFRKKRSTAHALHIARRVQDLAEQSGENIVLVLLDWEKTFDQIDQKRLIEAIQKLNIPAKMLNNINGLIIGELYNFKDEPVPFNKNTDEIVMDICNKLDIPIISNFPCGHGKYQATLPLSLNAEIDTSNKEGMVTILDSAVDIKA